MRQVYLVTEDNKPSIKFGSAKVISLKGLANLSTVDAKVGFWLLDANQDIKFAKHALAVIRQQFIPSLYLRPVVFFINSNVDTELIGCDATFYDYENQPAKITELLSKFEPVNQWIDKLPNAENISDTDLIFRVLRLIVSRDAEIVPLITAKRFNGFVYPLLDPLVKHDDSSIFHIFEFLEAQRLLAGRFITHAYFCCQCQCAFLNFKEICPRCDAEEIVTDELIHHFKCAYIAESAEFRQGDKFHCPKCDRDLKHIGVDYDKPSLMNNCSQCNFKFQEAKVVSQCFNCGNKVEPENQIHRQVKAYKSTSIGKNAAIFGLDALFSKIISSKVKFFSEPIFRQFLDLEIERIRRYKISNSSLAFIKFIDIENIYLQQGAKSEQFFEELSTVFKSILRLSDIVTAQNQSIFIILMTETSEANASRAIERLVEGISTLLIANLSYDAEIPTKLEEINADTDLDTLLEEFIDANVN